MKTAQIPNVLLPRFLLIAVLVTAPLAHAQDPPRRFTVTTVADLVDDNTGDGVCHTATNTCSLRAAIMQANQVSGSAGAVITVPRGTYLLTLLPSGANGDDTGDLNLTVPQIANQPIQVVGAGASSTIIDANHSDRAISIAQGRVAYFSGITIRNGEPQTNPGDPDGGGILNSGTLTISDSIIEFNHSSANGGGIETKSGGVATVVRSTLRSNVAEFGGALQVSGSGTVRDSLIHGNSANCGGGINALTNLIVVNSTISANHAYNGGGICSLGIPANTALYNVSVIDNVADEYGGGIYGGFYIVGGGDRFFVVNSLIAGNAPYDCNGTLTAVSWNLFSNLTDCHFTGITDYLRGIISRSTIGPLQNNGGPTLTHALLAGSPAINATNNLGCVDQSGAPLNGDQRGGPRGAGLYCDVGAFEYGAVVNSIFKNGFN
ncbi:MAG: CSLREA domain-containing protein [Tahibacter sp.]